MKILNFSSGYIAISAAIILSIVMLAVAVALGSSDLFTRFNVSDFDNKHASLSAARSCLDQALFKLAEDSNYAGNETFTVGTDACTVVSVTVSGANKIIKAKAKIGGASTDLQLTVKTIDLSTVSLEELSHF